MAAETHNPVYWAIHKAIHDKECLGLIIDDERYLIEIGGNGCRQVKYRGITFMEQNKEKASSYASEAKKGARITWGMRSLGDWILMCNDPPTHVVQFIHKEQVKGEPIIL